MMAKGFVKFSAEMVNILASNRRMNSDLFSRFIPTKVEVNSQDGVVTVYGRSEYFDDTTGKPTQYECIPSKDSDGTTFTFQKVTA